ncbi:MAG: alkene reductase [Pseudomonadaceae bacterium]|nr:MAG: alkene reductase [Pseudomonadaceae bacterium]
MSASALLQPAKVGSLDLPNRVIMAPLTRQRSQQPGNIPYALNAAYYSQRANAGLIISEATQVCPEGQGYAWTPGIYSAEQIAGWQQTTQAVHDAGGRIFLQLWHVGRISHNLLQPGAADPVAPSAIQAKAECFVQEASGKAYKTATAKPRALSTEELETVKSAYADGTRNALKAGFDGVEVHAANGYLLDQFLCPNSNQREDGYGGSIEKRARFVLEVLDDVIAAAGDSGKVGIRISPMGTFNGVADDNPHATFQYLVAELNKRNLGYLHVNRPDWVGGVYEGFDELLAEIRAAYQGTLILAGGMNAESGHAAIESGLADLIAFGRPYIANPDLVQRIETNAEWNDINPKTLYGGGAEGYTDYPVLKP